MWKACFAKFCQKRLSEVELLNLSAEFQELCKKPKARCLDPQELKKDTGGQNLVSSRESALQKAAHSDVVQIRNFVLSTLDVHPRYLGRIVP